MLRRNPALVRFFAVLVGAYAVWFVVYELWLLPDGRLDAGISLAVAATSAGLLDLLGLDVATQGRIVRLAGAPGVEVADGCNGLTTVGLFIGFVLAYPGAWARRAWFLPLGIAVVLLANIARVATLAAVQVHWPAAFDAIHSFGATTFFYVIVFGLWVAWAHLSDGTPRAGAPPSPEPSSSLETA